MKISTISKRNASKKGSLSNDSITKPTDHTNSITHGRCCGSFNFNSNPSKTNVIVGVRIKRSGKKGSEGRDQEQWVTLSHDTNAGPV